MLAPRALAHSITFSHRNFRFFFIIFRQLDEIHASVSIMTRNCMRHNRFSLFRLLPLLLMFLLSSSSSSSSMSLPFFTPTMRSFFFFCFHGIELKHSNTYTNTNENCTHVQFFLCLLWVSPYTHTDTRMDGWLIQFQRVM